MLPPPPLQLLAWMGLSLQLPFPATSGAPMVRPRLLGCAGGRGGARSPRARWASAGGQPEQVEDWWQEAEAEGLPWLGLWGQSTSSHLSPPYRPLVPARRLPLPGPLPDQPPHTIQLGFGG